MHGNGNKCNGTNISGKGVRNIGRGEGAIMNKVSREGLTEKVMFANNIFLT